MTEKNAICPRLALLVCFASVSESQPPMKILPDDFISAGSLIPSRVVQALEEGPVIPNREHTEVCLTLHVPLCTAKALLTRMLYGKCL